MTVLALDQAGSLGGACTTSGLSHKLPGRVGDSPVIGAGLYVDDTAGAAGGTGVGEEILRIGGSLLIVEALRAGLRRRKPARWPLAASSKPRTPPQRRGRRGRLHRARPAGRTGAACTPGTDFYYAVGRGSAVEVFQCDALDRG